MFMSDYIITPDSVEETQQDVFFVVYDSSQYHIPSIDTGINYCVTKDTLIKKEDNVDGDNDENEGEEVITFTV